MQIVLKRYTARYISLRPHVCFFHSPTFLTSSISYTNLHACMYPATLCVYGRNIHFETKNYYCYLPYKIAGMWHNYIGIVSCIYKFYTS